MRRSFIFASIIAIAVFAVSGLTASAQVAPLRGHVVFKQADGTATKPAGALVDVYRTDLPGTYSTKTDKNGGFVYAGLPLVGTYVITASMPNAAPGYVPNIKVGQDTDFEVVLSPGDGRRITRDEAVKLAVSGRSTGGAARESAADKAKREAAEKEAAEIAKSNEKVTATNQIVGDSFKAGNTALIAKNWDEAIKQYDVGLAADPNQAALLTNKATALKGRGVDKYNAAIQSKDEAARTAGVDSAKADFKSAAEAANKAFDILKKETPAADPMEQKNQAANKYAALVVRAEAMRLFVTKADATQVDAGVAAFQDYIAAETDPAKKARAQLDLAQMLFDANAYDKAKIEYEKILTERPDDADALANMGLILFNLGAAKEGEGKKDEAKAMYQQAANYLGQFVEKAPDTHKFKADAKAVLAELKNQQNVQAEKPATTPGRRKRP